MHVNEANILHDLVNWENWLQHHCTTSLLHPSSIWVISSWGDFSHILESKLIINLPWAEDSKELNGNSICGHFLSKPIANLHCSLAAAGDKLDGTVRLILDISAPRRDALNEQIDEEKFACKYSLFDVAIKMVADASINIYMAKIDFNNAVQWEQKTGGC